MPSKCSIKAASSCFRSWIIFCCSSFVRKKDFDGAGGAGRLGFLFIGLRLGVRAVGRMDWGLLPSPLGGRPIGRRAGVRGCRRKGAILPPCEGPLHLIANKGSVSPHPRPLSQRGEGSSQSHPTSLPAKVRASRGALGASAMIAGRAAWVETPLHRLRRSFPASGEAAAEAVWTHRFPIHGEAGREAD